MKTLVKVSLSIFVEHEIGCDGHSKIANTIDKAVLEDKSLTLCSSSYVPQVHCADRMMKEIAINLQEKRVYENL